MITSRYWDIEEDKALWEAIKEHGRLTEEQISLLVPRKTLNQCRYRITQLRSKGGPAVRSRPHNWSAEDNQKFLKLVGDETNSWSSIAKDMGMELTPAACSIRYQQLKRLNPQLKKTLKPNSYKTLAWKKRQFSEKQIEQYRQLLDSQTLIGKPEGYLSVEKVARIQEDRKKGKTIAQICQDHNIATRNAAVWHCKKPSTTGRHHRWIVEDYFKLWHMIMIDGLSKREASTRFDCSVGNCRSRVQIMQLNGLWLREDGTLSTKRTVLKFPRKKAVSCKRREEQLSDSDQPTDSDGDEHLLDDDTEQSGEEDNSLTEGDMQLQGNNQNKQDLRARNCTRTDSCLPPNFQSKRDIGCTEKKADGPVESLSRPHEEDSLENWNALSNTEAHSATESLTIKHEPQEDDKVIRSQEVLNRIKKRVLKEDVPEQKPEKVKKRKLSTFCSNPFTAKAAVDGQMAEVQPQELWLNASQIYKLPSIGRLPLFAEVLGQRNSTWIAELIEAREYEHRCHVLVRWMYRPRDLPVKLRTVRDRGKSELVLSDHFGVIDVDCTMRAIEMIDWTAYNVSPPHDQFFQGGSYYFRQRYNCLKKELSPSIEEK